MRRDECYDGVRGEKFEIRTDERRKICQKPEERFVGVGVVGEKIAVVCCHFALVYSPCLTAVVPLEDPTVTTMSGATQPSSSPPFFSMGPHTFQVSVEDVFGANRRKLVDNLGHCSSNSIVYLKGGEATTRFDSDHEPIFRQESYFWYLTGVKEPDCSVAIDAATGATTLFVPRLPADYATIMGKIRNTDEFKELYQVDVVKFTDEIEETLLKMLGSSCNSKPITNGITNGGGTTINGGTTASSSNKKLLLMKGPNSDSGKLYEPPNFKSEKLARCSDTETLFPVLAECRVIKSEAETLLLRHVTEITSFGHGKFPNEAGT